MHMVNTRPGHVKPGQSVDEAYRKWGYKLRRKRQATSNKVLDRAAWKKYREALLVGRD